MATLQSQINILVASLAQLYDDINNNPGSGGSCNCSNPFSLVKLNYENPTIADNKTFQALPTYVLAMDIDNSFPCTQYDVSLGIYESTVDGHKFEYVVPEKYTQSENGTYNFSQPSSLCNEFIHGTFSGNDNLKILFNFPQLINLGSDLTINTNYYTPTGNVFEPKDEELDTITFKKRSVSTPQQYTETIKKLRNMQTQIESQPEETCVDLVNENFESILYNNVYQLTENGNLTLKENTNHPLKKHLTLPQSDNIYILECDSNLKYHIE